MRRFQSRGSGMKRSRGIGEDSACRALVSMGMVSSLGQAPPARQQARCRPALQPTRFGGPRRSVHALYRTRSAPSPAPAVDTIMPVQHVTFVLLP